MKLIYITWHGFLIMDLAFRNVHSETILTQVGPPRECWVPEPTLDYSSKLVATMRIDLVETDVCGVLPNGTQYTISKLSSDKQSFITNYYDPYQIKDFEKLDERSSNCSGPLQTTISTILGKKTICDGYNNFLVNDEYVNLHVNLYKFS